ncbi:hypothetical protein AC579_2739, partial [Pseudocercospora musae]
LIGQRPGTSTDVHRNASRSAGLAALLIRSCAAIKYSSEQMASLLSPPAPLHLISLNVSPEKADPSRNARHIPRPWLTTDQYCIDSRGTVWEGSGAQHRSCATVQAS